MPPGRRLSRPGEPFATNGPRECRLGHYPSPQSPGLSSFPGLRIRISHDEEVPEIAQQLAERAGLQVTDSVTKDLRVIRFALSEPQREPVRQTVFPDQWRVSATPTVVRDDSQMAKSRFWFYTGQGKHRTRKVAVEFNLNE